MGSYTDGVDRVIECGAAKALSQERRIVVNARDDDASGAGVCQRHQFPHAFDAPVRVDMDRRRASAGTNRSHCGAQWPALAVEWRQHNRIDRMTAASLDQFRLGLREVTSLPERGTEPGTPFSLRDQGD